MSQETEAVVRRLFDEVWNERKIETIPEIFTPETKFYSSINPEPLVGPEPLKHYLDFMIAGFPDLKFTVLDMFSGGDKVAVRWVTHGKHDKPFIGVPPTGKVIKNDGNELFRVSDGKIHEIWLQEDIYGLAVQLGLAPPFHF